MRIFCASVSVSCRQRHLSGIDYRTWVSRASISRLVTDDAKSLGERRRSRLSRGIIFISGRRASSTGGRDTSALRYVGKCVSSSGRGIPWKRRETDRQNKDEKFTGRKRRGGGGSERKLTSMFHYFRHCRLPNAPHWVTFLVPATLPRSPVVSPVSYFVPLLLISCTFTGLAGFPTRSQYRRPPGIIKPLLFHGIILPGLYTHI